MRADISSRTTFIYKFIFPAIWIPLVGVALFLSTRGTATADAVYFGLVWIVGAVLMLRLTMPLMRVQLRDGRIFASNYRREIEIAPSEVGRITQNVWINIRPITLHLRHATTFGTRIRFIPPSRIIFAFWKEDPIVEQLRRFTGLVPPRS